jgi:hypothetical protein
MRSVFILFTNSSKQKNRAFSRLYEKVKISGWIKNRPRELAAPGRSIFFEMGI